MTPPTIPAFPEIREPIRPPRRRAARQSPKVTTPMISDSTKAKGREYSAIVNPTDSASMEVAIP